MKLLALILGLISLAVMVMADNEGACADKAPSVVNAIGKFCQKKNMVVPSNYASAGGHGYAGKITRINIEGSCSPAQWIPQEYCFSQFYDICVKGNSHGTGAARYGKNKCQTWLIANGDD